VGFSEWYCIDFVTLWESDSRGYGVMTIDGRCHYLPRKEVSPLDQEEFVFDTSTKAFKNGSISVSERFAKKVGWLNESD
jgi:hypothetical protein